VPHIDYRPAKVTKKNWPRTIPLSDYLRARLVEYRDRTGQTTGTIFAITDIQHPWENGCERVGFELRFHDLRHSFVRDMIDAELVDAVRYALAGHKSNDIHIKVYGTVDLDTQARGMRKLEA
jgi:integrase